MCYPQRQFLLFFLDSILSRQNQFSPQQPAYIVPATRVIGYPPRSLSIRRLEHALSLVSSDPSHAGFASFLSRSVYYGDLDHRRT